LALTHLAYRGRESEVILLKFDPQMGCIPFGKHLWIIGVNKDAANAIHLDHDYSPSLWSPFVWRLPPNADNFD